MPLLNFAPVLGSVYLRSCFHVRRRASSVDAHGRTTIVPRMLNNCHGIVSQKTPNRTEKADDATRSQRSIQIITQMSLQQATPTSEPDIVIWQGVEYTVTTVQPFPDFPLGWWEAEASSTSTVAKAT